MIFSADFKKSYKLAEFLISIRMKTIFAFELSAALWYNDTIRILRSIGGDNVDCHGGVGGGFI